MQLQSEVATKHGLSVKFVLDQIPDLVAQCVLEGDLLSSKEFQTQQTQKHLESLQEVSEPKSVETISDSISLGPEKILALIKDHNLGRMHQGKLFLPKLYLQNQEA